MTLEFRGGVTCRVFRLELALALHHAAVWAVLERVGVTVNAIGDRRASAEAAPRLDLAVELGTVGERAEQLEELADYLARVLSAEYAIAVRPGHVRVEWQSAGRLPGAGGAGGTPGNPRDV